MNLEGIRHQYLRRLIAPVLRGLGLRASTAIARRLARGVYELNTPARRQAEANLRTAFVNREGSNDLSEVTTGMYEHLARFWTEALFIPSRLGRHGWRRFVDIENEAGLQALAESNRGCLLATGYFGNIAAAAFALGHLFRPIHVIVDWFAQPELASWQREMYAQRWIQPLDRRKAIRELPRILSNGGAVLMVCEHERRKGRGVTTRFLEKTLNCYPTLGRLARWYDVPIGVVTCRRESKLFSFTLSLHEVIEDEMSLGEAEVVQRCMAALEHAIMQAPKQYLWSVGRNETQSTATNHLPTAFQRNAGTPSTGPVPY